VLLGRTPLPPRAEWSSLDAGSVAGQRVAAVRSLERAGASVHLLCADVADETSLRSVLRAYESEGWPEIAGVVHNAAVLDLSLSGDTTPEAFAAVLGPKLIGAEVLDRVFPDVELFMLSSSISASLAPTGLTSYTAANVGCDALASARRARGRPAVSVQWAVWDGVGFHNESRMLRNASVMADDGVGAITADEGAAYFMAAIASPASVMVVFPVDWSVFRQARRGRSLPLFRAIPDAAPDIAPTNVNEELLRSALTASPLERRAKIETIVRGTLGGILRRPAATLDARQPFGSMGVDSLMAVEIRNRLEAAIERPLSATLTWNYPTVDALSAHIDALLAPAAPVAAVAAAATSDATPSEGALLFTDIAELSDVDALRALRRGR
jgi:phthiocerol/phenolphthiocerol synthesis type-I polyketide synthase B